MKKVTHVVLHFFSKNTKIYKGKRKNLCWQVCCGSSQRTVHWSLQMCMFVYIFKELKENILHSTPCLFWQPITTTWASNTSEQTTSFQRLWETLNRFLFIHEFICQSIKLITQDTWAIPSRSPFLTGSAVGNPPAWHESKHPCLSFLGL